MGDKRKKSKSKRAQPKKARPTIGLLIEWIEQSYQGSILAGVTEAAQKQDANLVCFAGGRLRAPIPREAPRNVIYELASAENVDGLVITGASMSYFVSPEEFRNFHERYRPLPTVSIALALEDIPSVMVDNEKGLRDAITHLIEDHGLSHIAFICGPKGNPEAAERYQIYVETLEAHDIPLDPDLVVPGAFTGSSGMQAVHILLDERRADFEAIVAANDSTAIGALEALQARGIRVPHDVAVVGFDDIADAQGVVPSLTTVRQPVREQGKRAAELLLAQLAGKEVPKLVHLPTELVIRQSCGCLSPTAQQIPVEDISPTRLKLETVLARRQEDIRAEMAEALGASKDQSLEWTGKLLDTLSADLNDRSPGAFVSALSEILYQVALERGDVSAWHTAISSLRRHALPALLRDPKALSRAENLWQQARILIGETAQQAQAHRTLETERLARTMSEVSQELLTAPDMARLTEAAARALPRAGVQSCYIALYEGKGEPAEQSRLVLAYNENGQLDLGPDGRCFPSHQLVPEDLLPHGRRYTLVAVPLHYLDEQLGLVLIEVPQEHMVYEILGRDISTALRAARLLGERQQAEEELRRSSEFLDGIINALDDPVFVKDDTHRWVVLNDSLGRMMGFPKEELVGKSDRDISPEEQAGAVWEMDQLVLDTGETVISEEEALWDGVVRTISTKKSLFEDPATGKKYIVGTIRDLSDYKQAEEKLEQHAAILERRAKQLQAVAEVAREAAAIRDVQRLLEQAVRLISERFDFYHVGAFLMDEQAEYAILRAASSENGQRMLEQGYKLKANEDNIVGRVASTGEPLFAMGVGEKAARLINPDLPDTRSEVTLPLQVRGQVIGALDIHSTTSTGFTEEDTAILQIMTDQLATAIDNARLMARSEIQIRELSRLYGEHTAAAWSTLTSQEQMMGYVYDRIDVLPTRESPSSVLDVALEQGETVAHTETDKTEAVLAIPLKLRGQTIGVLGIQDVGQAREWSPDEIALAEAVSDQVAQALESARLFAETQRRAQRERQVYEITARLRRSPDIATILQTTVDELGRALRADRALVRIAVRPRETQEDIAGAPETGVTSAPETEIEAEAEAQKS